MIELICKELGVEVGKEWTADNGLTYIIEKNGDIWVEEPSGANTTEFVIDGNPGHIYNRIVRGLLKPRWRPKTGEHYWIPYPLNVHNCLEGEWENHEMDWFRLKKGLVFKTKEEAIETANKMLEAIEKY